eukprot:TRINITY_DN11621_c0_g1_i3.p1 TRINITY_DN11621_c0_g1~~TRINITY_DN11621_c0_g1_i3.p1  ORF type:complete len:471 (+),score=140.63 TRINITY_DN11621_c0_g1_i3:36-1448(+)
MIVSVFVFFFFFKQKTAYEMLRSLVGSEMCIRDRSTQSTGGRCCAMAETHETESMIILPTEDKATEDYSAARQAPSSPAQDKIGITNEDNNLPFPAKVCVVMNPISGGGRADSLVNQTTEDTQAYSGAFAQPTKCFKDAMAELNPGMEIKVVLTERVGHATDLAKQYAEDGWLVIGAGGDGTLREVVAGLSGMDPQPLCGFVSAGSMNFFAISAGIESPVKVAQCIKDRTSNPISVRSIIDTSRPPSEMLHSVEAIMFGIPVNAVQGQNWGRDNCCGPVAGLKLSAACAVMCPCRTSNHSHLKIKITQPDGQVIQIQDKYSWVLVSARHPYDGALDQENPGWISVVNTHNMPYITRFVKVVEDPFEFLSGTARLFEDSWRFTEIEIESLNPDDEGNYLSTVDGDLVSLNGVTTISAIPGAANILTPAGLERNPDFVSRRQNPASQKALESHQKFGGELLEVERGCACTIL